MSSSRYGGSTHPKHSSTSRPHGPPPTSYSRYSSSSSRYDELDPRVDPSDSISQVSTSRRSSVSRGTYRPPLGPSTQSSYQQPSASRSRAPSVAHSSSSRTTRRSYRNGEGDERALVRRATSSAYYDSIPASPYRVYPAAGPSAGSSVSRASGKPPSYYSGSIAKSEASTIRPSSASVMYPVSRGSGNVTTYNGPTTGTRIPTQIAIFPAPGSTTIINIGDTTRRSSYR